MTDLLAHRVHIKTSASKPYGRLTEVTLDGKPFHGVIKISPLFTSDEIYQVTMTFEAHVTVEEGP